MDLNVKELKAALAAAQGNTNISSGMAAMQLGMVMGASELMKLKYRAFVGPEAVVTFMNNNEEHVRFLVAAWPENRMTQVLYYEGDKNATA